MDGNGEGDGAIFGGLRDSGRGLDMKGRREEGTYDMGGLADGIEIRERGIELLPRRVGAGEPVKLIVEKCMCGRSMGR